MTQKFFLALIKHRNHFIFCDFKIYFDYIQGLLFFQILFFLEFARLYSKLYLGLSQELVSQKSLIGSSYGIFSSSKICLIQNALLTLCYYFKLKFDIGFGDHGLFLAPPSDQVPSQQRIIYGTKSSISDGSIVIYINEYF